MTDSLPGVTRGPKRAQPLDAAKIDEALLELEQVLALAGMRKSMLYTLIGSGLFVEPVRFSSRCVRWPAAEVKAINLARIAGKDPAALRLLVQRLHVARKSAAA